MFEKIFTSTGRKLDVNKDNPTSLLLAEACGDLVQNRLLKFATRPPMLIVEAVGLIAGLFMAPLVVFKLLIGALASYGLLVGAYLFWYGRFIHRNRIYRPLCPHCTSRMWQFCCKRCHEPVPALAFWLWGAFLTHCPHCGFRLSCRLGTLLASCSTCASDFERPDLLYGKPTHVVVWIAETLPAQIGGGWIPIKPHGAQEMALYHHGDEHSASFLFISTDDHSKPTPVDEHLIGQTRLLLISNKLPETTANRIKAFFTHRTLREEIAFDSNGELRRES